MEQDPRAQHDDAAPARCPVFHGVAPVSRDSSEESRASIEVARNRAVRWWLVGVGMACVAVGGIGVLVPGLPTTIFLIIASWCFVRSCPMLERVLIRNRFFGPFMRYLSPGAVMPTRARVISSAMMWTAVSVSVFVLASRGVSPVWIVIVLIAALIGTVAVWRVARGGADGSPAGTASA